MKKIIVALLCLFPLAACAQEASDASQDTAERNKMLYSLGFLLGDNLKRQLILDNEDDYKAVSQGMRDSLLNKQAHQASFCNMHAYPPFLSFHIVFQAKYNSQGVPLISLIRPFSNLIPIPPRRPRCKGLRPLSRGWQSKR